jgi:hypothetical protein
MMIFASRTVIGALKYWVSGLSGLISTQNAATPARDSQIEVITTRRRRAAACSAVSFILY